VRRISSIFDKLKLYYIHRFEKEEKAEDIPKKNINDKNKINLTNTFLFAFSKIELFTSSQRLEYEISVPPREIFITKLKLGVILHPNE